MSPETSTLLFANATREILLVQTVMDVMGICVTCLLLRALSSLRQGEEPLPGLRLLLGVMLITELLRALWLAFSWLSKPAPPLLDLMCFVTGFIVLVGVPITVSAKHLAKPGASSLAPRPWIWLQRAMVVTAVVCFSVLLGAVSFRLRSVIFLGSGAAYTSTAIILLSRVSFYRHLQVRRRPLLLFVGFMVAGLLTVAFVCVFTVVKDMRIRQSLELASLTSAGLSLTLCAVIFLFANVRFADVLVKRCLRIIVWASASLLAWMAVMHSAAIAGAVGRTQQDVVCLLVVCNLIAFTPTAERILNDWIGGWVFEQPDLPSAVATLWSGLVGTKDRDEAFLSTEIFLQETLSLAAVRVQPAGVGAMAIQSPTFGPGAHVFSSASRTAEGLDLPADVAIPLFVDGQAEYVVTLSQGSSRPPLTRWEMDFVERVAARLQIWLGMRTAAERSHREASLREELTGAELRALRAQVNPHFLFNSLNTIADLAVTAPNQAEEMTVRLSSVFRYVLLNTDRQFTSLKEELEFARSYLHIEQTRFGDRLTVHFDVDPSTLDQQVPTLLLQPLIENALKHGIAPRREGGTLTISSRRDQESVLISIADDGVGLQPGGVAGRRSTGVGVDNVVRRLQTAYGGRASVTLQRRSQGGTEALIRMPEGAAR